MLFRSQQPLLHQEKLYSSCSICPPAGPEKRGLGAPNINTQHKGAQPRGSKPHLSRVPGACLAHPGWEQDPYGMPGEHELQACKGTEAEGSEPKYRGRLDSQEAVSMGQVAANRRRGALTPPSCPRDHLLPPAAWRAPPTGGHTPWSGPQTASAWPEPRFQLSPVSAC